MIVDSDDRRHAGLLLETRSIPRSGLHYMRNMLESVLGMNFYFCEWYNEPGCCRTSPCRLGRSLARESPEPFRLTMVKSHDFDFSDPVDPPEANTVRLILVRDPIFVLTSWWSLYCLDLNKGLLQAHGVNMTRVNYRHDKRLVQRAHAIVGEMGHIPGPKGGLETFLNQQTLYLLRFLRKWQAVAKAQPGATRFVNYTDTHAAVINVLAPHRQAMAHDARSRFDRIASQDKTFKPRADPFTGPSLRMSMHLAENADMFRQFAERVPMPMAGVPSWL